MPFSSLMVCSLLIGVIIALYINGGDGGTGGPGPFPQ